ncbi:MAG: hypothetical protein IPJ65_12260 [Archangiaceae bacterium]|nr:hypothetical protein [Archangiaceae bacterium]
MRLGLLVLLVPSLAAADERSLLYVNPAPLVTASRLVAMGGAAVGLAENSESLPFNYAAVAHRHPHRAGNFDFDFTAGVLFSPFTGLRDTDNEGQPTTDVVAPVESQLGALIQFSRFGLGVSGRFSSKSLCPSPSCLSASANQWAVVFGFNVARDQLVFGIGAYIANANFKFEGNTYEYRGWNFGAGMLWRPIFYPFRIGVQFVSQTSGTPTFDTMKLPNLGGSRTAFSGVISPAKLSVGASARFGEGAWRFNRLSQSALKQLPDDFNFANVPHDLDPDDPRPPGRLLVTAGLDLIFPVHGATTLTPFVYDTPAVPTGENASVVPRLGFEVEAIDHRLRLRSGGYLEPPFVQGSSIRPHFTWGTEVFLLNIAADWSVSASMDIANRYLAMSFGIGWWT